MYANPIYLPEFSNREDLLLTVSVYDDDTGQPIDFSGVTRAVPGDYTTNLWMVTDGPIVTTSQTVLTIPDFPIGNELEALALTVDPGLNILPGDPVSIANLPGGTAIVGPVGPPAIPFVDESGGPYYVAENFAGGGGGSSYTPGPNTMTGYVTSYAAATGALVVQIGSTFQCEIRALKRLHEFDRAYGSSWDNWGTYDYGPVITLSLGHGLTIIDTGILQIRSPESIIRKLNHRTYGLSLTMTDSYDTRQAFIARLPIQYGGVTQ